MTKSLQYIEQIKQLVKAYGASGLAQMLQTTERAVMYWVAEDGPKMPREATVRKIGELFMKHEAGENILKTGDQAGIGEKYVRSLEKTVTLLEAEVSSLKDDLIQLAQANQSILMTNQNLLIELVALQKRQNLKKVAEETGKANSANYKTVKQKRNLLEADR